LLGALHFVTASYIRRITLSGHISVSVLGGMGYFEAHETIKLPARNADDTHIAKCLCVIDKPVDTSSIFVIERGIFPPSIILLLSTE
jgi:hypothetical protein